MIDSRIENLAHELALEFNEMKYISYSGDKNMKFVYEYTHLPVTRKRYVVMEIVKEVRTIYVLKDGDWVQYDQDVKSFRGNVEFFIDGISGFVFKPQGAMPAKTPRYDITNATSFKQMVANRKVSQHSGWLYQDFKNVEVA